MIAQIPAPVTPFLAPHQLPHFITQLEEVHSLVLCHADSLDQKELTALYTLFAFTRALRNLPPETTQ